MLDEPCVTREPVSQMLDHDLVDLALESHARALIQRDSQGLHDRANEYRDELLRRLAQRCPATLIHPLAQSLIGQILAADAPLCDPEYPHDVGLRLHSIITERNSLREAERRQRHTITGWQETCFCRMGTVLGCDVIDESVEVVAVALREEIARLKQEINATVSAYARRRRR